MNADPIHHPIMPAMSFARSVFLVLTLGGVQLAAQSNLAGKVVDRSGQPVSDATVSSAELHRAARTTADGQFDLGPAPAGQYTLLARKLGYAPGSQRVTAGTAATLTLADAAVRIEPVNVTAARDASDAAASPLTTTALSGDEIHRRSGISLAQSISSVAGVRNVSTGIHIGKPMIRGLFGPRVLVAHDGSRLEDYSWSEEDGPSIDARLADRVEIIRGPASVLYGSDAVGGVVNVVPTELPYSANGSSFTRSMLEGYFGSNALEAGAAARLEGARGTMGWRLLGTSRMAQSFHTPNGEVENTGFLSANVDGAVTMRKPKHSTTLRFSHYGGEFKLLEANGPAPVAGVADAGPERKLLDDRVQLSGLHELGKARVETRAQFQRHSLIEVSDDCVPTPPATTCTPVPGQEKPAFDLLLNTATVDVLFHHPPMAGSQTTMHGTIGTSALLQSNDSRGPIYLVPSARATGVGVFAFEELTAGRLSLSAGARWDAKSQDADANAQLGRSDDSRSYSMASVNVGAVVGVGGGIAVVGNFGTGWRPPTLFELYANGPHAAEARYERGDPTLEAELSKNVEGGLRFNRARGQAEAVFFQSNFDGFIYTQAAGTFIAALPVFEHVQADGRLRGLEAAAEYAATDALTLRARHEMVEGDNTETNGYLPFMPPMRSAAGVEVKLMQSSGHPWRLGGEVEHVARPDRLAPLEVATDAYTLVNLDAETERMLLPGWHRSVRLSLDVRNALNAGYKDFLSRYKQFAQNPGVNVVVRLSTEW